MQCILVFCFYRCKTGEENACLLLSCFLDIFKLQDVVVDFQCKNQCHVSVLQRAVSKPSENIHIYDSKLIL